MQIQTEGIIVDRNKFGENGLILTIFTKDKGLLKALLKGALKSKNSYLVQLGNVVDVVWYARLETQLGSFKIDLKTSIFTDIFFNEDKLLALSTICNLITTLVPEGDANEELYNLTKSLLVSLSSSDFFTYYIKWEILLLSHIGYGLDFSVCAVCNKIEPLAYVSPKTGKAVCENAGKLYKNKLLKLPEFLTNNNASYNIEDKKNALILTEYFINKFCSNYKKPLSYYRKILTSKFLSTNIS